MTTLNQKPKKKYQIIYADPPWSYRGRKQFGFAGDVGVDSGGAVNHYLTLSREEISRFDIPSILDEDCLLFLWVPNPLLKDGFYVAEKWGFTYATIAFVWDKQRTNPGYYTLSQCELCFVFKKGKRPQPQSKKQKQFISKLRGRHSLKPYEVRERISKMFPTQERIELFAREKTEGWDVWGNEVESDIEL